LKTIPDVGDSIARAIHDLVVHGRLAMLDQVRGHGDRSKRSHRSLASVPCSRIGFTTISESRRWKSSRRRMEVWGRVLTERRSAERMRDAAAARR